MYTPACVANFIHLHTCPPTLIHKIVPILRGAVYFFSTEFHFWQVPWLITSILKAWLALLKTH